MSTQLIIALTAACLAGQPASTSDELQVDDVFLTLAEQIEVPALEAGVLTRVLVREGQRVERGETLARVDDMRVRMALERAQAQRKKSQHEAENEIKVQLAEKAHEVAVAELKRARDSRQRLPNSVSDSELDRLRLASEQAALAVRQAQFEREVARLDTLVSEADARLARHEVLRRQVLAPFAGMVVEVKRRQGEWVEPGQAVLRLVRLDRVRAEGWVAADHLLQDVTGRGVVVSVRFGDQRVEQFAGEVVFVSPEIHPVNGKVRLWAEIENRDQLLRPGLKATLKITSEAP